MEKKTHESMNNRLALVMKSGKYTLGYKTVLKTLTNSKGEAYHGIDLSSSEDELSTLSLVANLIRSFKSAEISEVASRNLPQALNSVKSRMTIVGFMGKRHH